MQTTRIYSECNSFEEPNLYVCLRLMALSRICVHAGVKVWASR